MIQLFRPAVFDPIHQPHKIKKIKELMEFAGFTASEEDIQWAFIKHSIYFGLANFNLSPEEITLNFAHTIADYLTEVRSVPAEAETRQITINT